MTAVRLRALGFIGLLLVLLFAFLRSSRPPTIPATLSPSGSIEVRFSRPSQGRPPSRRGGPDAALAQAIDEAERSIDMAIYDLDLWSIRDALLRAHRRGVEVRLVAEADNLGQEEFLELIAAGIPVVADGWEPLMHDKFTVIDERQVWTGSMNYTVRDAYFNDNNLLRLTSTEAAQIYRDEFEEMFSDGAFGPFSPAGEGRQLALADGTSAEVYFAPDDAPLDRILELVDSAQDRIDFLGFALTSEELAEALIASAQRGVRVRGVIEAGQAANLGSQWDGLRQAGLDVHLDGNPDNMHHKVILIDASIVISGSYNFSRSAETQNDENLIVLFDAPLADVFLEEFERVYALAG
jgi:phosphatidylserine/phosphatidylglycerophosphate/cardiolipin synthase-like enzyme